MQTLIPRRCQTHLLAAAVLASVVFAPIPAHAIYSTCLFQGEAPGYVAYRLDLPNGASSLAMGLGGGGGIYGVVNEDNYYFAQGIEIFHAASGTMWAWRLRGHSGQVPRVVVSSGDETIANEGLLGPDVATGWSDLSNPGGLPKGVFYAVGFGFGGGRFDDYITVGGLASCERVNLTPAQQELISINQTDFSSSGGSQTYVIGAGKAQNITKSFTTTKNFFVGYILGGAYCSFTMTYSTPASQGTLKNSGNACGDQAPSVWKPGLASFTASYQGALPVIDISGWALDLPYG